jgi:hypothetical protein
MNHYRETKPRIQSSAKMEEILAGDSEERQTGANGKVKLGETLSTATDDQIHEDSGNHSRDWGCRPLCCEVIYLYVILLPS